MLMLVVSAAVASLVLAVLVIVYLTAGSRDHARFGLRIAIFVLIGIAAALAIATLVVSFSS
jgi:hypothetical protein